MSRLESWFSLGIWTLFLFVSISMLLILFMNRYGTRWLLLYFGIFIQLPKISLYPTRFSNIVFGRISFKSNANRSRLLNLEFLHISDTRKLLLWIRKNTTDNTWLFSCSLITFSVNRRNNTQYHSESNVQEWYKKAKMKMNLAFYWIRAYILDISIEKCLIIKCMNDADSDTRIDQHKVKRISNMFYISSILQYIRTKFKDLVNNLIQKWSPHLLFHFSAFKIDYFKSINNNLNIIHAILSDIDFEYKPYKSQVIITLSESPKKFFFYQTTLKLGSIELYHQDCRIIFSQSLLFMDLVFQVPITNQLSQLSLNYFSIQFGGLDFQIPSESWIENQLQIFLCSNSGQSTNEIMYLVIKESNSMFIYGKCEFGTWTISPIDNDTSIVYFQILESVATWNDSLEHVAIVIKGISSRQNQFSTLMAIPEITFNVNYNRSENILMISCNNNSDKDSSNISITLPLSLIQRYYDMIPTRNITSKDSKSKNLDIDIKLECLIDVSIITKPHKIKNSIYENTFRYRKERFKAHICIDRYRNLQLLNISFDSINISCNTLITIVNNNEKTSKPITIHWTLFELLEGFKFVQKCHKSTKISSLAFGTIKLEPLYSLECIDGNSHEKILPSLAILLGQLYYFKASDFHSIINTDRYFYQWELIDIKEINIIIPFSDRKTRFVWDGALLDKNLNIGQLSMTLAHQDHVLSRVIIPEIEVTCDSLHTIKLKDDSITIGLDIMDLIYIFTIVNIHVDVFYTCCCIEPYNPTRFVHNINDSSYLKLMIDIQDDVRWANLFLPLNMNSNDNAFFLQIPMIEFTISLPKGSSNIVEEIIIYINQFSFGCDFNSLIWGLDLESISIKASTDINNSKDCLLLNLDTINVGNFIHIPDRSLMMDFSLKSWKEYLINLMSGSIQTKNDSNLLFPMFILDPSSKVSRPSMSDYINGFKNSLFKIPSYCSFFVSIQNLQIVSPFNFPIYNIIDTIGIMIKMFKKKWLSNLIIDNSFNIESTEDIFLSFSCIISCSFIRIQWKKDALHALLSKKSVTLSKRLQRYHLEKQLRENVFWSKVLKDMQYIYDVDDYVTTKDEHSEAIEQVIDGMLKKSNFSFKSLPAWIRASQNPNILVKNKKIRDAYYQFLVIESSNWIHATRKPFDKDEEILSEILIKELNLSLFPPIPIIDNSFYLSNEMINYLNKLIFPSSFSLINFQMHELFELFKNVWCCSYCSSIEVFLNKAISREPFVKVCDLYGEGLISVLEKYRTILSTFKKLQIDQYVHPITESWSCIYGSIHPVHLLHSFQINISSLSIRWNLLFQNHQLYEWSIYCIDALDKPVDLVNEPWIATLPLPPWDKARWIMRSSSNRLIVKKNFWIILDFGTFNEIWIGSQNGACLEQYCSKVDSVFRLQIHIKAILRSDRFPMLQYYLETEQGFKIWDELQFEMEFDENQQILNLPIFKMYWNIEFEIVWNLSEVTLNWINNYNIMYKYLKCHPDDQSARIQMEALRLSISHNDIQSILLITPEMAQQLSLNHYDAYEHFRCISFHLVIRSRTETKETDSVLFCYYPEISHFFQNLCPWISTLQDLDVSRPSLSLNPTQIISNKKTEKFNKALTQIYLDKISMPEVLIRYVRFITFMENDETRVQFISFLAKIEKLILDCWLIQGHVVFLQTDMSHVSIQLLVDLQDNSPVDHIPNVIDEDDEDDDDWLFDLLPSDIQKEQRYRFPKLKQYPFVYISRLIVYKMIRTDHTHQATLESCNPFVKSCYKSLEAEFEHSCQMLIETDPKDNLFTFKQIKKEIHMLRERKEFMMNHLKYFLNSEDDLQNVSWSNIQHWISTNTCIRWNATFRNALFNLFELISDESELMQAMKRGGIQKLLRKEINEQSKKLLFKSGIKHKISSLDEIRVVDALIERLKAQEQATQDESLQISDEKDDSKYLNPMGHSDELEMLLNLIDQTTLDLLRILSRIHIHFVECQIAFEEPASSILLTTDKATLELGYWAFKDSNYIEPTHENDKLDQIDSDPAIKIIRRRTFFLCEGTELWAIHKREWMEKRMKRLLHVLSVLTEPGQVEPSYQTLIRVPFMEGWPPFQFHIANEIMIQNEDHDPNQDMSSIHAKILEKSRLYVHYETRDPRLSFNIISDSSLSSRHKYVEISSQDDILSLADRLMIQFLNDDWKLTTTSLDYCSIYNIITLLLVYSDPNRRSRHEKIKEYLLSWREGIATTSTTIWNELPVSVFSSIKNDNHQEIQLDDDVEVTLKSIWNALITRLKVEKFKQGESLKEKLKSQALSIQSEMRSWISLFRSINRFIGNINDRQHWLRYAPYWIKKGNNKQYDEIIIHNRQEFIIEKHKLVLLWYFLKNIMHSNHAWMWLKKSLTNLTKKGLDSSIDVNAISTSRFQVYASTRLLLHIPKVTWTLLDNDENAIIDANDDQHQASAILVAQLCNTNITFIQYEDASTDFSAHVQQLSVKNVCKNAYYDYFIQPLVTSGVIFKKKGIFSSLMSQTSDSNQNVEQPVHIRFFLRQLAPVGGISIIERVEINIFPTEFQLTYDIDKKLFQFLFPEREDSSNHLSLSNTSIATFSATNIQYTASKKAIITSSSESNLLTKNMGQSSRYSTMNTKDLEEMKHRASHCRSFIAILVPSSYHCVSYKGRRGDASNIEDIEGVILKLNDIEYKNKTWSWYELIQAIKKDSIRLLLANTAAIVREKLKRKTKADASDGSLQSVNRSESKLIISNKEKKELELPESEVRKLLGLI